MSTIFGKSPNTLNDSLEKTGCLRHERGGKVAFNRERIKDNFEISLYYLIYPQKGEQTAQACDNA
jgi:hypothetical protein